MTEERTVEMAGGLQVDTLRPKAVAEFLDGNHRFLIPSFQRGYRWGDKQVMDLLDDMLSFVRAKAAVSYFFTACCGSEFGRWSMGSVGWTAAIDDNAACIEKSHSISIAKEGGKGHE